MKIGGVEHFQGNTNIEYMPAHNTEIFKGHEYRDEWIKD